jgi:hypothetical protein
VLKVNAESKLSNASKLKASKVDIHFGSREQMNPLSENIFQNIKKFGTKILHVHQASKVRRG